VYLAQKAAGMGETPTVSAVPALPTFAVIASKNRRVMLTRLVDQLAPQVDHSWVFDNGYEPPLADATEAHGWPLHKMWNQGLAEASEAAEGPYNVLIINDDVEVAPDLVARLEAALRSGEYNMAIPGDGRMTGWCFMLRGEANLRLDEQFEWWYGDTDLAKRCEGRIAVAPDAHAKHLDPMRSTLDDPVRLAQARSDEAKYAEKWGLDPSTLWLASYEAKQ
jgi:hypothetical protein